MAQQAVSPSPDLVAEARQKINAGERRPENFEGLRPYFCRGCGTKVMSNAIPRGWYLLSRARGNWDKHQRLGLFCSAECIAGQCPRMVGIEKNLGDRWDQVPSPYQQE